MGAAQPAAASTPESSASSIHTISLFVNNTPGVLVRVALVFSRRGFNIESLVVSPAAEGRFSRMTVTCSGAPEVLEQVVKQLAKLVDVVHAIDHTGDLSYETEIALLKKLAVTTSSMLSPFKSAAVAWLTGRLVLVSTNVTIAGWKVPSPLPSCTVTEPLSDQSPATMSGFESAFMSATKTDLGLEVVERETPT